MDERELEVAMLAGALVGAPADEWTFQTAFEQLDGCGFECEGGLLVNNTAYRWLKEKCG